MEEKKLLICGYHLRDNQRDEADNLVKKFHYSARPPSMVELVLTLHKDGGLFGFSGEAVAAIFFSIPPTRWAESVLELSRLVRNDYIDISLTSLISAALKLLRTSYPQHNLLVSFADSQQGHHGGIYQASSWNYDGMRESRVDGFLIDNVFVPARSCNTRWGTSSYAALVERLRGHTVEPHYDTGKHLYWKALSKEGVKKALRLCLEANSYPKPNPDKVPK